MIHLARRDIGLFVAPGNPKRIRGLRDLVRPDVQFVNRQAGSGTRMMLELMLARESISPNSINGFEGAELTHAAVAAYIASGMADVGIGVHTAAAHFGLDFIPLVRERYFFAFAYAQSDDPVVCDVIGILRSPRFQSDVNALAGYDATDAGSILSLPEAFQGARLRGGRR